MGQLGAQQLRQRFVDRRDAGQALAQAVADTAPGRDSLVLALPRGGVPVAYEVARRLRLPLDVLVVRKLGLPSRPELAMGAVASGGAIVRNADVIAAYGINNQCFDRVVQRELAELGRRVNLYRAALPPLKLEGRAIVLVDDGIATGSTMMAAVKALRQMGVKLLTVAVPAAAPESLSTLQPEADQVISLMAPTDFPAVGWFYEDFRQVEDEEVRRLLADARLG